MEPCLAVPWNVDKKNTDLTLASFCSPDYLLPINSQWFTDWMTWAKCHPPAMTLVMALRHPVHSSHCVFIPHTHLSLLSHTHSHACSQAASWSTNHFTTRDMNKNKVETSLHEGTWQCLSSALFSSTCISLWHLSISSGHWDFSVSTLSSIPLHSYLVPFNVGDWGTEPYCMATHAMNYCE